MSDIEVVSGEVVDGRALPEIATSIHQHLGRARDGVEQILDAHLAIGHDLSEARTRLTSDNDFGAWVESQNFGFKRTWAWTLRQAAEHEQDLREVVFSQLNTSGEANIQKAVNWIRREENAAERAEIQQLRAEKPNGKFQTIVIDPPWPMAKIEREERPRQQGFDYPALSLEDLKDPETVPVIGIAEEDCHLYLWVTQKHLPWGLELTKHWGFNYQCLLTWVKNVGFTPFSWMYSTEHVIFARRGSLDLLQLGRRLDFTAQVREHSRKPDEFYDLVREVSPEPRIDMFARGPHEGFEIWGTEKEKFADAA